MSKRTGMANRYLLGVMKTLFEAGLVNSTRGIYGGYRLAKPANHITLLAVYEAVAELPSPLELKCDGLTAISQRIVDGVMLDIADDTRRRLLGLTITDPKAVKA